MKRLQTILTCTVAALILIGCSDGGSPMPSGDPARSKQNQLRGYSYSPDVLSVGANSLFWAQQFTTGYRSRQEQLVPGSVTTAKQSRCRHRRPTPEQHVQHVVVGGSNTRSQVNWLDRRELRRASAEFFKRYTRSNGKAYFPEPGSNMQVVNVIVTKTHKPAYLVLSSVTDVLWNFSIEEGAQLDQVVLLSNETVATANLPETVRTSVTTNLEKSACGAPVARMPQEHWGFVRNISAAARPTDEVMMRNVEAAKAFKADLDSRFGRIPDVSTIDALNLSNVLIQDGSRRQLDRVPFRSIEGADVVIYGDVETKVAHHRDFKAYLRDEVTREVEAIAGAPLSTFINTGS